MKYSNDAIGNQTRDLPACSALPRPTVPPHAPMWLAPQAIQHLTAQQRMNTLQKMWKAAVMAKF